MEHDLTVNPKTFKRCTLLGTMKSDNVIDYSNVMWLGCIQGIMGIII